MEINALAPATLHRIAEIEASCTRLSTPMGQANLVWRRFGNGPPLVLLHGGGGSWLHWLKCIEPLSRRYTLLVPDLPGHGDSDLPSENVSQLRPGEPDDLLRTDWAGRPPLSIRVVARLVAEGIAQLVPDGDVALAGFSFGGAVGCHVSEILAPRIGGIVLIGAVGLTSSSFGRPRSARSWRGITDREEFRAVHRDNIESMLIHDAAKVDDLTIDVQIACTAGVRTRRTSRRPLSAEALARAGVPVSGIWGEYDVTARDGLEAIRTALLAVDPLARLAIVPNAGHWVAWEDAAAVSDLIPSLLDQGLSRRKR